MYENKDCNISEAVINGIRVLYLNNDLLKVSVLAGKGSEISQITYKPMNMDVLLKTKAGLDQYKGRDLKKQRLTWYSELFTGGWSDVLPDRGIYRETEIVQKNSGIAATLPWDCEVLENNPESVCIRCFVKLPVFPLFVEKIISLKKGSAMMHVEERVKNDGESAAIFTWTQHSAFGGDLLDENVILELPGKKAFRAIEHAKNYNEDMDLYECPVEAVKLSDGTVHNLLEMKPNCFEEELFVTLRNIVRPEAVIYNKQKKTGVRLNWDFETFPYLRYWYRNSRDLYTVALEPANYYTDGLKGALVQGTVMSLEPGQVRSTCIECEIFE